MYDAVDDVYLPASEGGGAPPARARGHRTCPPPWLTVWVQNYLRACGVRDSATTEAVIGAVVTPLPATPRDLVDRIHAALTARGTGAAAQPMLPQVSPPELPGAMPRQELAPVWSLWMQPVGAVFRRTFGIACGGLFAFLMTLFDHGQ